MASAFDPNHVILTGENPFIRLSNGDEGADPTTTASFWRIVFSGAGPGHVLFLKSELTDNDWWIFSDNIALTRWLQSTVQGMLNGELSDTTIPVTDADFAHSGDVRSFWTERVTSDDDDITLTWYEVGEPHLRHTMPFDAPDRPYGVCSILVPCAGARLTVNGEHAEGAPSPSEWDGVPFSSSALAFSESWTERA